MDYDTHTGLSYQEIVSLKAEIDQNLKYPHKYFWTATWEEVPKWATHLLDTSIYTTSDGIIHKSPTYGYPIHEQAKQAFEAERELQLHRFLIHLACNTKAHLLTYNVISRPYINKHFHSFILSDIPITPSNAARLWIFGKETSLSSYNPRWAEDNGEASYRGAVSYAFGKHHEHRLLEFGDVFCPAKKKACRRGNCSHRRTSYKMKTKMQRKFVRA